MLSVCPRRFVSKVSGVAEKRWIWVEIKRGYGVFCSGFISVISFFLLLEDVYLSIILWLKWKIQDFPTGWTIAGSSKLDVIETHLVLAVPVLCAITKWTAATTRQYYSFEFVINCHSCDVSFVRHRIATVSVTSSNCRKTRGSRAARLRWPFIGTSTPDEYWRVTVPWLTLLLLECRHFGWFNTYTCVTRA